MMSYTHTHTVRNEQLYTTCGQILSKGLDLAHKPCWRGAEHTSGLNTKHNSTTFKCEQTVCVWILNVAFRSFCIHELDFLYFSEITVNFSSWLYIKSWIYSWRWWHIIHNSTGTQGENIKTRNWCDRLHSHERIIRHYPDALIMINTSFTSSRSLEKVARLDCARHGQITGFKDTIVWKTTNLIMSVIPFPMLLMSCRDLSGSVILSCLCVNLLFAPLHLIHLYLHM